MKNKVAILLWLYNTDLAQEFTDILFPHRDNISIFLGLCKDNDNNQAESLFIETFKHLDINYFDNGGTDILPTLNLLEKAQDYPFFFKLHSKKSNWGKNRHVNWRVILVNDILYGNNFFNTILGLQKTDIGIVASKSFIMRNHEYTNSQIILELSDLLGIDYSKLRIKSFIGGNIFAAKTELFKPFINKAKLKTLLSKEVGLIKDDQNGTYVHSMERLFGYMAEYNNQNILGRPISKNIILNPNIKQHRLHLVKLYNNDCYIQENPNVYGQIIEETDNSLSIKWKNTEVPIQKYIPHNNYLINTNVNTKTII